uniref:Uncharacterized protein n=1 Tax=Melanopsichium pennsylvanicum 4 TaxID=1398559 RepID=A0A077RBR5_9BASI|nr:uncharacterized protein BN887_06269 [Melanopsichium pennsylvanicum 4]
MSQTDSSMREIQRGVSSARAQALQQVTVCKQVHKGVTTTSSKDICEKARNVRHTPHSAINRLEFEVWVNAAGLGDKLAGRTIVSICRLPHTLPSIASKAAG